MSEVGGGEGVASVSDWLSMIDDYRCARRVSLFRMCYSVILFCFSLVLFFIEYMLM